LTYMNCRSFQKQLEDYLQGGLDFSGRLALERHAQRCFACGKVLADAERLGQVARTIARVGAPPDFEAALRSKINQAQYKNRAWRPFISWQSVRLGAASAIILIFLGLGTLYSVQWWSLSHQTSRAASGAPASLAAQPAHSRLPVLPEPLSAVSATHEVNAPVNPGDQFASTTTNQVDGEWSPAIREIADPQFREYQVPGPGDRKLILRLPDTIRMQYDQPSEEYFIRNVSH
jgi:hypothetical protein